MNAEEAEAVRKWDELTLNRANANLPAKELASRIVAIDKTYRKVFEKFIAEQKQLYKDVKAFEKQLK